MLLFALVRAVEIVGEASSKVSAAGRDERQEVPWSAIVGMRNRLVHAYFEVDPDILWATVTEAYLRRHGRVSAWITISKRGLVLAFFAGIAVFLMCWDAFWTWFGRAARAVNNETDRDDALKPATPMRTCERCGVDTEGISVVSVFDSSAICIGCFEIEERHPSYGEAQRAKARASMNRDRSFAGVGLPADFAKHRSVIEAKRGKGSQPDYCGPVAEAIVSRFADGLQAAGQPYDPFELPADEDVAEAATKPGALRRATVDGVPMILLPLYVEVVEVDHEGERWHAFPAAEWDPSACPACGDDGGEGGLLPRCVTCGACTRCGATEQPVDGLCSTCGAHAEWAVCPKCGRALDCPACEAIATLREGKRRS